MPASRFRWIATRGRGGGAGGGKGVQCSWNWQQILDESPQASRSSFPLNKYCVGIQSIFADQLGKNFMSLKNANIGEKAPR